jgi:hypothetical protein
MASLAAPTLGGTAGGAIAPNELDSNFRAAAANPQMDGRHHLCQTDEGTVLGRTVVMSSIKQKSSAG